MPPVGPAYHFSLPFEVRDYECDLQGIVNNAVYQHYLEHARHQFLKRSGLTFAQLNQAGINLVVVRADIEYKAPLRSGDAFIVGSRLLRFSPVRFGFLQEIQRTSGEGRLMLRATITCAAMDGNGRPIQPTILEPMFEKLRVAEDGA